MGRVLAGGTGFLSLVRPRDGTLTADRTGRDPEIEVDLGEAMGEERTWHLNRSLAAR